MRARCIQIALLIGTVWVLGGCGEHNESWGRRGEPADVRDCRTGWTVKDVRTEIGSPVDRVVYRGVRTGWEEWIYPTGSIFLYRLVVKHVVYRGKDAPLPDTGRRRTPWHIQEGEEHKALAPVESWSDF